MELDIVYKLLAEGGPLALALGLMLFWNRRDAQGAQAEEKRRAEKEREDKILLIGTLQHNTEVLSELTTLVKRMNGRE